ncbi:aldo/keto reductase [Nannocystis radixulma]|uniref:Aldo/keto reductase n=1 Tax=Nannocystis radixulma TaxID=2995305 RepID=A0ABT5B210_9BACT|nr:aldo/keto reductase [Nannocystis radixulma]MDC0667177.1 aldo/keto reductase [Nannocystis radixulma]
MSDDLSQKNHDFATSPATIRLGDLEVTRLGYGAMRLPGKDVWGEPEEPARARAVLRRVIELGINFIDTAWFYGPHVANRLLAEALHPYPKDLVIATKLGGRRTPDTGWAPFARPEELRQGCEEDLRTLRLERCDVTHLRYMPGSGVPFRESLDAMIELQKEGKIRHIALSNVGTAELLDALERTPIVAVQNLYNVAGGLGPLANATHAAVESPEAVLAACEARGIAYLPFFPLATGDLGKGHPALDATAARHGATPAQLALAWLLARSPVMLPIPGTSSLAHLEENWAARTIALTRDEVAAMAREARAGG